MEVGAEGPVDWVHRSLPKSPPQRSEGMPLGHPEHVRIRGVETVVLSIS